MKRTYFHGTTADNLESILANGLSASEPKIWDISHDAVYLWEPERVAHQEGCEDEDEEYKIARCFDNAFGSAQCALSNSKDCRAVIVEVELEEDEVDIDDSCDNMDAANCIRRDILPSEIKRVRVSNDLGLFKGYFISLMLDRELCSLDFNVTERLVAKIFQDTFYSFFEEIDSTVEWEEIPLNVLA